MTPVFASRRRAEEFHSLVEARAAGAPRDARLVEFLEIVEQLRDVPAPEPRPEFVGSLREQLMTAADTLLVPSGGERLSLPVRSRSRDRRLAAAVGGFAVVGATASMALAAQSALPGEMLYPLKRAIEDARVGVTPDRDAKALSLLDSASSRLEEVEELGRRGDLSRDSATVSAGLVDFGSTATEAADLLLAEYADTGEEGLIRELRDFTAESIAVLTVLEGQVPDSARDELVEAAGVVSAIDDRAERACPTCGGAGVDQIPPLLLDPAAAPGLAELVVPGLTVQARPVTRRDRPGVTDARPQREQRPPSSPATTLPSTTDAVTAPDPRPTGGPTGGGGTDDPLEDLAGAVTGDGPTISGGRGPAGDLEDAVEDVVDDVGETLDDVTDGVDDSIDLD